MPIVLRTKPFNSDFLQLNLEEQKQVIKTLRFLAINPRHPSLQTHKIEGTGFFEAYVNMDIRVIFERSSDTIVLQAIVRHDIFKNY